MTCDPRGAVRFSWYGARALSPLAVAVLFACGAAAIVAVPGDGRSRSVEASVGQEIDIVLGNVGGGTYLSPPAISSPAVAFLSVDVVPPYTPAGPTQRFQFRANNAGKAILTFRRVLGDSLLSIVEDTIQVR